MKHFVKIITIILIVCTLFTMCVCLADGSKDYSGYKKYVSLGDSIPAGIGENNEEPFLRRVPGAYPDLLANALGAELTQLACGGMRTVELRACLEEDYTMPDEYTFNFTRDIVEKIRPLYAPAIAEADIITLTIGTNDIISHALVQTLAVAEAEDIRIDNRVSELNEKGYVCGALIALLKTAETSGKYAKIAASVIDGLAEGYIRFLKNWDAIMSDIFRLNPDAVVLATGFYNPLERVKLTEKSHLDVGKALNGIFASVNNYIRYGSEYSDKYIYVDMMGVESITEKRGYTLTDDELFDNVVLAVHPSLEGHADLAERFLRLIPEKGTEGVPASALTHPLSLFLWLKKLVSRLVFSRKTIFHI